MSDPGELDELIGYLARTSRLTSQEARRLVEEVLSFLRETPEEFVRRRHRALQAQGLPNPEVYAHSISREISRSP